MLGMVIPLSKVVRYIYMEMTAEMFPAARRRWNPHSRARRRKGDAAGPGTPPGA